MTAGLVAIAVGATAMLAGVVVSTAGASVMLSGNVDDVPAAKPSVPREADDADAAPCDPDADLAARRTRCDAVPGDTSERPRTSPQPTRTAASPSRIDRRGDRGEPAEPAGRSSSHEAVLRRLPNTDNANNQ